MPNQMLYLTEENYNKLKTESNMSALVNTLLTNHYKEPITLDPDKSIAIIEEVKAKMATQEEISKINAYMDEHTPEYLEGVKLGKWKSMKEFYYAKHI